MMGRKRRKGGWEERMGKIGMKKGNDGKGEKEEEKGGWGG